MNAQIVPVAELTQRIRRKPMCCSGLERITSVPKCGVLRRGFDDTCCRYDGAGQLALADLPSGFTQSRVFHGLSQSYLHPVRR